MGVQQIPRAVRSNFTARACGRIRPTNMSLLYLLQRGQPMHIIVTDAGAPHGQVNVHAQENGTTVQTLTVPKDAESVLQAMKEVQK